MDDWLDRFAADLGLPALEPDEIDAILELARVVAHGTERRNAPLAAFLAGRRSAGAAPAAPADALAVARASVPPPAT